MKLPLIERANQDFGGPTVVTTGRCCPDGKEVTSHPGLRIGKTGPSYHRIVQMRITDVQSIAHDPLLVYSNRRELFEAVGVAAVRCHGKWDSMSSPLAVTVGRVLNRHYEIALDRGRSTRDRRRSLAVIRGVADAIDTHVGRARSADDTPKGGGRRRRTGNEDGAVTAGVSDTKAASKHNYISFYENQRQRLHGNDVHGSKFAASRMDPSDAMRREDADRIKPFSVTNCLAGRQSECR